MIRLAVVDDHHFVRTGIAHHFAQQRDIVVVSCVADPEQLGAFGFDVLLLDLYLKAGRPAIDAIGRWSAIVPVLVMSYSGRAPDVLAAVRAGASGYHTKEASEDAFVAAVREVAAGGFAWSPSLAGIVEQATRNSDDPPQLSIRERQVLGHLARGFTHQQIGTRLGVAQSTVDTYVKRIRTKLGLGNKAELTHCAITHGLLTDGDSQDMPR